MATPNTSSPTSPIDWSGNFTIDPLLNGGLRKWGNLDGGATTISFSFPFYNGAIVYWAPSYSSSNEQSALQHFGFNATQVNAVYNALAAWSNVANLTFVQVADNLNTVGDIRFAFSSAVGGSWGVGNYPGSSASAGDIWVSPTYASDTNWSPRSYNFKALMHEIGHALGLKHPFDGPAILPSALNARNFTIMSYTDPASVYFYNSSTRVSDYTIITPMVLDIQAIQYLYGPNMSYDSGNDTYRFDPAMPTYQTIWDAGGTDTIDVSLYASGCTINLLPGGYSTLSQSNWSPMNNLGIAYGVTLENVVGGRGNDVITANDARNTITGGAGNDVIDGGRAADVVVYRGTYANHSISRSGNVFNVVDRTGANGADSLVNVERLQFNDRMTFIESPDNANIARLYSAALNRAPDLEGLNGWEDIYASNISAESKAKGVYVSLAQTQNGFGTTIAGGFAQSAEFRSLYGTLNDPQYVSQLYHNVLGRNPEPTGLSGWLQLMTVGDGAGMRFTRDMVLVGFAESPENIAKSSDWLITL